MGYEYKIRPITLKNAPGELEELFISDIKLCQRMGAVGELVIELVATQALDFSDPVALYADFNACLGSEITCEIGDSWEFSGRIEKFELVSKNDGIRITVRDALSSLDQSFNSRVFSECSLKSIIKSVAPDAKIIGTAGDADVPLAIQYQESDLAFLARLLADHGAQLWCSDGYLFAGNEPGGVGEPLDLTSNVYNYVLQTELGPEEVEVTSFQWRKPDNPERSKTTLKAATSTIQKGVAKARKKHQGPQTLHYIEELAQGAGEHIGERFLRTGAAGRFLVRGTSIDPVSLGTKVNFGDEECMVRMVEAVPDESGAEILWKFEVVSVEAFNAENPVSVERPFQSTAIVQESNDAANRVRVYFPWDPNETTTCWMRVATSSWGDGHHYYAPLVIGDMVLVSWGQTTMDPVVLGAVPAGDTEVKNPEERVVLRTDEGHLFILGENYIRLHNQVDSGDTKLEILNEAVLITCKNGEKVVLKDGTIEVNDGNGAVAKLDHGNISLDATQIDLNAKSAINISSKKVTINDGALEIT